MACGRVGRAPCMGDVRPGGPRSEGALCNPCLRTGKIGKAPHLSRRPRGSKGHAGSVSMSTSDSNPALGRRDFLREAAAGAVGGCCLLVPAGAGLVAWLDPLSRSGKSAAAVKVGHLSALPSDGTPQRVTVVTSRADGWTREPAVPVGAIYLRRTAPQTVQALHSMCPHAGCFVDYRPEGKSFFCPCHDSTFALDGTVNDPKSPSPRGMDDLKVELRGDEVWVHFQQFRTGIREKVAVS